jgi:hypothetical protein
LREQIFIQTSQLTFPSKDVSSIISATLWTWILLEKLATILTAFYNSRRFKTSCYNSIWPFVGVQVLGSGFNHSPHLASSLKKEYSYTSTTLLCLHGMLWDKFYLFTLRFYSQEKLIRLYRESWIVNLEAI